MFEPDKQSKSAKPTQVTTESIADASQGHAAMGPPIPQIELLNLVIEHCKLFRKSVDDLGSRLQLDMDEGWKVRRLDRERGNYLYFSCDPVLHNTGAGFEPRIMFTGLLSHPLDFAEVADEREGGDVIKEQIECGKRIVRKWSTLKSDQMYSHRLDFDFRWDPASTELIFARVGEIYLSPGITWTTPELLEFRNGLKLGVAENADKITEIMRCAKLVLVPAIEMVNNLK